MIESTVCCASHKFVPENIILLACVDNVSAEFDSYSHVYVLPFEHSLGLLLGTQAPIMMPSGADFSFLSFPALQTDAGVVAMKLEPLQKVLTWHALQKIHMYTSICDACANRYMLHLRSMVASHR